MAMIFCPECQREVSDKAIACLNCGAPIEQYAGYPMSVHGLSLTLSIVGLIFSLLLPIIALPCLIVGLVQAIKKKPIFKTTAAIVMCIIGLVITIANSAIGAFMGANGLLNF